jgi:hypothetical protein
MNKNLAELLHKKQKSATGEAIDWDERRDQYISAVKGLYHQIESMLADPIHQKTVTIRRHAKQLTENYIGTYSVDDLVLIIGNEQVRLSPRGRNIAGAAGRVDVVGERGEAILVLQDSGWVFVQAPFDESTFTEVLQLVMRD